jgi:alpha-1,2-mannosyltransferase
VSWGHHWVWLSATVAYLVMRWSATGQARNLAGALLVAAVTLVPPWILLPAGDGRERLWNPLQHLLGATWAVAALLLLAVFAAATPPPPASAPGI